MEKSIHSLSDTKTFCTIIEKAFFPFALSLFHSLVRFDSEMTLKVLITDQKCDLNNNIKGVEVISVDRVLDSEISNCIYAKYSPTNSNILRWALKPVFISYLLNNGYNKVIYSDPDTFYVGDYQFLFEELNSSNILLTPHWRNIDPLKNEDSFYALLKDGLFNAGFIATNRYGLEAINWWAGACYFKMERQLEYGVYDDQKYLDILPVAFENIKILKHKGCNVAFWNIDTCKRKKINGKLLINGKYQVIFIHFTPDTIRNTLNGNDLLLRSHLKEYENVFISQGESLYEIMRINEFLFSESYIQFVKRKLLIRTRLKRFLFRLAEVI